MLDLWSQSRDLLTTWCLIICLSNLWIVKEEIENKQYLYLKNISKRRFPTLFPLQQHPESWRPDRHRGVGHRLRALRLRRSHRVRRTPAQDEARSVQVVQAEGAEVHTQEDGRQEGDLHQPVQEAEGGDVTRTSRHTFPSSVPNLFSLFQPDLLAFVSLLPALHRGPRTRGCRLRKLFPVNGAARVRVPLKMLSFRVLCWSVVHTLCDPVFYSLPLPLVPPPWSDVNKDLGATWTDLKPILKQFFCLGKFTIRSFLKALIGWKCSTANQNA